LAQPTPRGRHRWGLSPRCSRSGRRGRPAGRPLPKKWSIGGGRRKAVAEDAADIMQKKVSGLYPVYIFEPNNHLTFPLPWKLGQKKYLFGHVKNHGDFFSFMNLCKLFSRSMLEEL